MTCAKTFDSVIFYGGRNGWTGADDKAQRDASSAATSAAAGSLPIKPPPTCLSSQSVSGPRSETATRTAQPLVRAKVRLRSPWMRSKPVQKTNSSG